MTKKMDLRSIDLRTSSRFVPVVANEARYHCATSPGMATSGAENRSYTIARQWSPKSFPIVTSSTELVRRRCGSCSDVHVSARTNGGSGIRAPRRPLHGGDPAWGGTTIPSLTCDGCAAIWYGVNFIVPRARAERPPSSGRAGARRPHARPWGGRPISLPPLAYPCCFGGRDQFWIHMFNGPLQSTLGAPS